MPVDVFISYAGADRDIGERVASTLRAAGLAVWWDGDLQPDEEFDARIQAVLAEAVVVVGVLSPTTLASDWVRWELSQAHVNGLRVIPVLADGARAEDLPPPLTMTAPVVLQDADRAAGLDRLTERVRVAVGSARRGRSDRPSAAQRRTARRRLASAASQTARRAADIKRRNRERGAAGAPPDRSPHGCSVSEGFAPFLGEHGIAIAATSPDGDRLYLLGCDADDRPSISAERFDRPTGLHVAGGSVLVAAGGHVHRLENILRGRQRFDGVHTHCYVPRTAHFVGEVDAHDVAIAGDGRILFASSRYSCVAAVSRVHSFELVWHPAFVSEIVAEDRCHLNGLAVVDGRPAYATACAETDQLDGWRAARHRGGVVVDVQSDEVVCTGLSMPHSPRLADGRLWVLNSGTGEIGFVDTAATPRSAFTAVAWCPGFVRGLSVVGDHALVGVSRPRHGSFDGLALDDRLGAARAEPWTGIAVIDLRSGECVHTCRIDGDSREVYDVAVLAGVRNPTCVATWRDEAHGLITME